MTTSDQLTTKETYCCPDCGHPGLPVFTIEEPEPDDQGFYDPEESEAYYTQPAYVAAEEHAWEYWEKNGIRSRRKWIRIGDYENQKMLDMHRELMSRRKYARRGFGKDDKPREAFGLHYSWECPEKMAEGDLSRTHRDQLKPAIALLSKANFTPIYVDGGLWIQQDDRVYATDGHGYYYYLGHEPNWAPAKPEHIQKAQEFFDELATSPGWYRSWLGHLPDWPWQLLGANGEPIKDDYRQCRRCRKELTDDISRKRMLGQDCWEHMLAELSSSGLTYRLDLNGNYQLLEIPEPTS